LRFFFEARKGSGGKIENIGMKEDYDFEFVILINLLFLIPLFVLPPTIIFNIN
jgi:hypothetical protein